MFRDKYPLAWTFHRNTSRWPFNMQSVPEQLEQEAPFKEYLGAPLVPLPQPDLPAMSLRDALAGRASCRSFGDAPLALDALATLLASAYGLRGQLLIGDVELLERPVPSGGGLYALELYLLIQRLEGVVPGIYHYAAQHHALEQLSAVPLPHKLVGDLFMGQPYVGQAAAVVVISAVLERSLWKYKDRGYRYILFEAGHVAQNVNLVAAALGLGSLNLGGFFDGDLAGLLGLDLEHEVPLYGIAIGAPAAGDQTALRLPGM